jgi:serine/threonine protein phosphatase PrpC
MKYYTYTNPNRKNATRRNGDYCSVKELAEENLLFLLLADGVDSTDKHWIAAQDICEKTYEYYRENENAFTDIQQRLSYAIIKANSDIYNSGVGYLTTFCIVVVNTNTYEYVYTWLGDSRIIKITKNSVTQLTEDQIEYELFRMNDEPMIIHQSTQYRKLLKNAIGYKNIDFQLITGLLDFEESLILYTDGFFGVYSDDDDLVARLNSRNYEEKFNELCKIVESENEDDATIILLKNTDNSDSNQLNSLINNLCLSFLKDDKENVLFLLDKILIYKELLKTDFVTIMERWGDVNSLYKEDIDVYAKLNLLRSKLK